MFPGAPGTPGEIGPESLASEFAREKSDHRDPRQKGKRKGWNICRTVCRNAGVTHSVADRTATVHSLKRK